MLAPGVNTLWIGAGARAPCGRPNGAPPAGQAGASAAARPGVGDQVGRVGFRRGAQCPQAGVAALAGEDDAPEGLLADSELFFGSPEVLEPPASEEVEELVDSFEVDPSEEEADSVVDVVARESLR